MNILAIRSGKIASGKAEVIDGIQQIGFTAAIGTTDTNYPMMEGEMLLLVIAKLNQSYLMKAKHGECKVTQKASI